MMDFNPSDIAKICLDIAANLTKSESEQEGVRGTWVDHQHLFEEGRLKIDACFSCDGPQDVMVSYNGKVVLNYMDDECYEGGKENIILYDPGKWEEEVLKLYEKLN